MPNVIKFDLLKFSIACKIWRNMHDFTIADMAEMAGIAKSTYGFIETGDRAPTMAEFAALCTIIEFAPKEFFFNG